MKRDFVSVTDFTSEEIRENLELAIEVKAKTARNECPNVLAGGVGALIFHKASLRTRCSFEVGFRQLGGHAVYITDKEIEVGSITVELESEVGFMNSMLLNFGLRFL